MKKLFLVSFLLIGITLSHGKEYKTIYECTEGGYFWCPISDTCLTGGNGSCKTCKKGEGCKTWSECASGGCGSSCSSCVLCEAATGCSTCKSVCPNTQK